MPIRMTLLRDVISLSLVLAGASLAQAQAAPETAPTDLAPAEPAPAAEPGAPLAEDPGFVLSLPASAAPAESVSTVPSDTGSSASTASAWDYLEEGQGTDAPREPTAEELAALGMASDEEIEHFPKIDLYGFADFTLAVPLVGKDNSWEFYFSKNPMFYVGNINLYVASQMSSSLRSLLEVRFTYLPNGQNRSTLENATPGVATTEGTEITNTAAFDYADAERIIKLGAIEIERVQLEYDATQWLTLVVGQWLTPYGLWNIDHGSPTTIGAHKPYVVGEQLFPERQTGIMAQGGWRFGSHRVAYNLGVSNGRGPFDAYYDMDKNKAGTLHLSWQTTESSFGEIALGASGYMGRFTSSTRTLGLDTDSNDALVLKVIDDPVMQYDEYSLAADLKWVNGGFQVFAEAVLNSQKFTKRGRSAYQDALIQFIEVEPRGKRIQPNILQGGGYLISGYRFKWYGVMPFLMGEYVDRDFRLIPKLVTLIAGLNIRPHESVALKLSYGAAFFPGASPLGPGRDGYQNCDAQVAWAF